MEEGGQRVGEGGIGFSPQRTCVRELGVMSLDPSTGGRYISALNICSFCILPGYTGDRIPSCHPSLYFYDLPPETKPTFLYPDDFHGLETDFSAFTPLLKAVQRHPITLKMKRLHLFF